MTSKFSPVIPPKLPAGAEPDARGLDSRELVNLRARMDALADETAGNAKRVVEEADEAAERAAAEAKLTDELNAEARAIESDNHTRLTNLLLRDATYGTGAFVLGKLLFGSKRTRNHKESK